MGDCGFEIVHSLLSLSVPAKVPNKGLELGIGGMEDEEKEEKETYSWLNVTYIAAEKNAGPIVMHT
jgi:hypothetical protein